MVGHINMDAWQMNKKSKTQLKTRCLQVMLAKLAPVRKVGIMMDVMSSSPMFNPLMKSQMTEWRNQVLKSGEFY